MRERILLSVAVVAVIFLICIVGWGIYQLVGNVLFYALAVALLSGVLVFIADVLLEPKEPK